MSDALSDLLAKLDRVRKSGDGWSARCYCVGRLVGIQFKTIDGTKLFSQMSGSSTDGLYGAAALDPRAAEVLIVEGPEDAALAISHGFSTVAINAADARERVEARAMQRLFNLPFVRCGHAVRIPTEVVDRFITANTIPARGER